MAAGGRAGARRTSSGGVLRRAPDQPHTTFSWKRRPREAVPAPFVELLLIDPPAGRAIEVHVGRLGVLVEPGFDAARLCAVVAALEERVGPRCCRWMSVLPCDSRSPYLC